MLNSKRSSAEDVSRLLEMDVGMSSKILKLANSSYYNPAGEVTSVHRAVIQLGFNVISSIVVSASAYSLFKNPESPVNMNRVAFWRHSIDVALNARVLATISIHHLDPEIAFTQGMLHDLGALVLDLQFPQEYAALIDQVRRDKKSLHLAELELFGLDHGEVGALLLARWGIPEIVRMPIQDHHHLQALHGYQEYTKVLALANYMSNISAGSYLLHQKPEPVSMDQMLEQLGISQSEEDLQKLLEEERKKAKLVMNLLRS